MGVREHLRRFKDFEAQVCTAVLTVAILSVGIVLPAYYPPLTRCRRRRGRGLLTTHYLLMTNDYLLATYYSLLPRWRRRRGR